MSSRHRSNIPKEVITIKPRTTRLRIGSVPLYTPPVYNPISLRHSGRSTLTGTASCDPSLCMLSYVLIYVHIDSIVTCCMCESRVHLLTYHSSSNRLNGTWDPNGRGRLIVEFSGSLLDVVSYSAIAGWLASWYPHPSLPCPTRPDPGVSSRTS